MFQTLSNFDIHPHHIKFRTQVFISFSTTISCTSYQRQSPGSQPKCIQISPLLYQSSFSTAKKLSEAMKGSRERFSVFYSYTLHSQWLRVCLFSSVATDPIVFILELTLRVGSSSRMEVLSKYRILWLACGRDEWYSIRIKDHLLPTDEMVSISCFRSFLSGRMCLNSSTYSVIVHSQTQTVFYLNSLPSLVLIGAINIDVVSDPFSPQLGLTFSLHCLVLYACVLGM
ncbi:hypothetical protein CROQUDRAFT_660100 [Cronartium quercuum f. sp. fusiforme G11]|uniref:Uncharacterized protein n=1 Tax=Cronartium quercuum f. sp. fusiforme G11 TaxID=708437 RepID=A0A9P6NE80_9BASI|nr:hypothetical protein CROQUDRAFT_660100 [Cronartium quercuum f. sp. fusiforme G11]